MTAELKSRFAEFFAAVNSLPSGETAEPFPWQMNLVEHVADTGQWPDLLDLPTAAGKTAVIDIAVFLMAIRYDIPRRLVFVIDRRVVVHQAAQRARQLAELLRASDVGIVRSVAARLGEKAASVAGVQAPPMLWAELRGGIVRDESWALRPDVPAVLVSTVDQVGSRLLFRGYGVSRGMLPVHAGLLGTDALFLLDEVHLAQPFAETLRMIADRYRPSAESGLPDRWRVVTLSATPTEDSRPTRVLRLGERDRDPLVAPVLARRLAAQKFAEKRLVKSRDKSASGQQDALAHEAAKTARAMTDDRTAKVIGVVVNRVNTARRVYDVLGDGPGLERALITGRMRPLDRDDLLAGLVGKLRTGRVREEAEPPVVVVATQSIEAGADFDFDALVTECASFDALKQRFGRVDRDGQLTELGRPSKSVVLSTADNVTPAADDAIYGSALTKTWAWMPEQEFDFARLSPAKLQLAELVAARPQAPKLLPSHLDRWVQTSPQPDASPDIGLWLHGMTADRAVDVSLVWRADLTEAILTPAPESEPGQTAPESEQLPSAGAVLATSLVTACRPGSAEAMSVPIQAVRTWLAGLASRDRVPGAVPVADVEGAAPPESGDPTPNSADIKPALRWNGDDSRVARQAGDIRPGDTLIIPAAYGGISAGNWDPASREPVADLGHRVQAEQRRRAVLRLSPAVLASELDVLPSLPLPADVDDTGGDDEAVIDAWLATADLALGGHGLTGRLVRELRADDKRVIDRVVVNPVDDRMSAVYVIASQRQLTPLRTTGEPQGETADSEPATSSFTGVKITLDDHLENVGLWATALGGACGLPDRLARDLALAARLHDVGKADPRFQLMLRQGRLTSDEMLAKSVVFASERAERERARWEAGYPRGGRHELLSVAMVQDQPDLAAEANDWDLVLHLIASHHGYCRPFAPVVHDPHPVMAEFWHNGRTLRHSTETELARIDSGVADRFWKLVRRYGWFGLAQLEGILRLADHRASAAEQIASGNGSKAKVKS